METGIVPDRSIAVELVLHLAFSVDVVAGESFGNVVEFYVGIRILRVGVVAENARPRLSRVTVDQGEVYGFLRLKRTLWRNLASGHDFIVDNGNMLVLWIDSLSEGRSNVFPRPGTEVEVSTVSDHAVAAE